MIRMTLTLAAIVSLSPFAAAQSKSAKAPQLDMYGDPLPPGASARFGSLRFRLPSSICDVAVSPDGRTVAAVNSHGAVGIFEASTGQLLHWIMGSKAGESAIAFSPDSRSLATGSRFDSNNPNEEFRVRVWSVQSGKATIELPAQKGPISKVQFTCDGKTLVVAERNDTITAWKVSTGAKVAEYPSDAFCNFAISRDDKWIAISARELNQIQLFAFNGTEPIWQLDRQYSYIHAFEFSPDGKSLFVQEQDRFYFVRTDTGRLESKAHVDSNIWRIAKLSPDGKKVAALNGERIDWLEPLTGKTSSSWKCGDQLSAIAFSEDGRTVATGAWNAVRLWNSETGQGIGQLTGPKEICYGLDFSADGKTAFAASYAGFHFLDGETLKERTHLPMKIEWNGYNASFTLSPDGKSVAFIGKSENIEIADSRRPGDLRQLVRQNWKPRSLAFTNDGKRLIASGNKCPGLAIWNLETGREEKSFDEHLEAYSDIAVARKAEIVAVVEREPVLRCRFWDIKSGKELDSMNLTTGPVKYGPSNILLSDDGKILAAYHTNSHISVWDVVKKSELHQVDVGVKGLGGWAMSPDGKFIAKGNATINIWSTESGKQVREIHGHRLGSPTVAMAFSPADGGLITSCTEKSILRWSRSAITGR